MAAKTTIENRLQTIKALQATQCKKSKKLVGGLSLVDILTALQEGLGIRKKAWTAGRFAYLAADGQTILIGHLYNPCREDATMENPLDLNAAPSEFEIVDAIYMLKANLVKRVSELHNLTDAKLIQAAAKALGVTVESYSVSC
jgi:hypothetical protein